MELGFVGDDEIDVEEVLQTAQRGKVNKARAGTGSQVGEL